MKTHPKTHPMAVARALHLSPLARAQRHTKAVARRNDRLLGLALVGAAIVIALGIALLRYVTARG